MKFSSNSNTKVQSCLYPLFQNQCPHFLLSALFWKLFSENYLNPQVRINKMVNKHTVDYHPSPSQITCKGTPFHISLDSGGGLSLQNLSWVFPKSVYSTIPFKKNESVYFISCIQAKLSRKFLSLPVRQKEITHSSQTAFSEYLFSNQRK